MARKRKAAFSSKAGRPGKTAPKTTVDHSTSKTSWRQRLQRFVVCAACWGLIPIAWAEWIVKLLEVGHD